MPALGEQRLERRPVDEVTLDRVLQVGLPVEPDGAADVALLVGRRCPRRPRRARPTGRRGAPRPSRRRPGRRSGSCAGLLGERCARWPRRAGRDGSRRRPSRYISQPRQNAERGVQERCRQRETDRDQTDGGRAERPAPRVPTSPKAKPTPCAKRGGAGASSSVGGARRGRTKRRNSDAVRAAVQAGEGADREDDGLRGEQPDAAGQQHDGQDDGGDGRGEARSTGVDHGDLRRWWGSGWPTPGRRPAGGSEPQGGRPGRSVTVSDPQHRQPATRQRSIARRSVSPSARIGPAMAAARQGRPPLRCHLRLAS